MESGTGDGTQNAELRHSFVMTMVFTAVTPVAALLALLAIALAALPVALGIGVVGAASYWQLRRWQANTGHDAFSRAFASEAAEILGVSHVLVRALVATFTIVLAIVVPALAIAGIAT